MEPIFIRSSFSQWAKSHNSEVYGQPSGWLSDIQQSFVLRFFPFLLLNNGIPESLSFAILSGNQRN